MNRTLILVRHGRSDFDSDDLRETPRGRQWDPPLDEEGRRQADLLGARLLLAPDITTVYCSPFRRALQTVAPYAQGSGREVHVEEDLGEAYIGQWENRPFEEILASDDQMLDRFRNQDAIWLHAPDAERV